MTDPSFHPAPEELFAYRDGELSTEQRLLVEAHVSSCRACRERIDGLSGFEAALRQRPDQAGDDYYAKMTDSVMARIRSGAAVSQEAPPAREEARGPRDVAQPAATVEVPAVREEPRRPASRAAPHSGARNPAAPARPGSRGRRSSRRWRRPRRWASWS